MSNGDKNRAVVGVFHYLDDVVSAARALNSEEFEFRVYSPFAVEELEEFTHVRRSPVRFFTFAGGVVGLAFGFLLAVLSSLDYPLRTSAKPLAAIPAYVPIGYECTILFAALATFGGMALYARLPYLFRKMGYDRRFSDDKFGLAVACGAGEIERVRQTLMRMGAVEVKVEHAL